MGAEEDFGTYQCNSCACTCFLWCCDDLPVNAHNDVFCFLCSLSSFSAFNVLKTILNVIGFCFAFGLPAVAALASTTSDLIDCGLVDCMWFVLIRAHSTIL